MNSRLIFYDTTNYIDFPIGGQLTSVRNLLRYLCECHAERIPSIVLVGVTRDPAQVGRLQLLRLYDCDVSFLPVACAEEDLGHTAHSLRLKFAKGLLQYGKLLHVSVSDCNYIQTPEAFGPVKLLNYRSKCVIFSHGSYANMERGFRFFRKNILLRKAFGRYLKWIIRKADLILVLDEASRKDYRPYNARLLKASNSIILPEDYQDWKPHEYQGKLLFVGRLSRDKGIAGIIRAMERMTEGETLTIVGDGEERAIFHRMAEEQRENRRTLTGEIPLQDFISFTGAVAPDEVGRMMERSDILIMNSDFEGVPMTILEAFSHGLPVISTNVGGIADTVRFGDDALQTDGTPESIAAAVHEISQDYENFAECAHAHAAEYSHAVANRKIYEALCAFWK